MSMYLNRAVRKLPKKDRPKNRAELLALRPEKDFGPGKTKQSFKDETNINRLLGRAQRDGTLSWLEKHGPNLADYGESTGLTLFEAQLRIKAGKEAFMQLPSEVRKEFKQDPRAFYEYAIKHKKDLAKRLPALAEPGRQMIDASGRSDPTTEREAAAKAAEATAGSETKPTEDPT